LKEITITMKEITITIAIMITLKEITITITITLKEITITIAITFVLKHPWKKNKTHFHCLVFKHIFRQRIMKLPICKD